MISVKNKLYHIIPILLLVLSCSTQSTDTDEGDNGGGGNQSQYTLHIEKTGEGEGYVKVNGSDVNLPYTANFEKGAEVTLNAYAGWGGRFVSWGGDIQSSESEITLTMNQDYNIVAYFINSNSNTHTITVQRSGSGASDGYVFSIPGGISCGSDCAGEYEEGDTVKIIAQSTSQNVMFDGFSGDTFKTHGDTAYVVANTDKHIIANFRNTQITTYTLNVSKTGRGTVISDPPGISCGLDCSEDYVSGTTVTLTATPEAGYLFNGWDGACSGSSPNCTVTMNSNLSVIAKFVEQPPIIFDHFNGNPFDSGWAYGPGTPTNAHIGYSNSTIYPLSYGPGSGWHGPEIIHDLDTTIDLLTDNFEASAYIITGTNDNNEEGILDISLLDENGTPIIRFKWYDSSGGGCCASQQGHIQIDYPDGSSDWTGNDFQSFSGVIGVRKTGETYTLFVNTGDVFSKSVTSTARIKKVKIAFLKWADQLSASTLKVDWVRIKWLPH